ncbi:MAG: hypothetical protein ACR2QU_06470 [Gammaproteobacteria bacterium]
MIETAYQSILALNLLWFGAGAWYFGIKRVAAAKLLVPGSARSSPIFATLTSALPFLAGMNLAFSLLATILLLRQDLFTHHQEQALLLMIFGIAHASQFLINVPVARRGGRIGESYWDVLTGPMLFIFAVDALMAFVNIACAIAVY